MFKNISLVTSLSAALLLSACSSTTPQVSQEKTKSALTQSIVVTSDEYRIKNTQTLTLESKLLDRKQKIHIAYPIAYDPDNKIYPVIYVLDAQWHFPLVQTIYGNLNYDMAIPDAIIVGITWDGDESVAEVERLKDFSPIEVPFIKGSGNAANFLAFMKEELIPHIDNNYPSNQYRVMIGASFSGLFSAYTLLTEPELFDTQIAISAPLKWGNNALAQFQPNLANTSLSKPTKAYFTRGEYEYYFKEVDDFARNLSDKNYPNLDVKFATPERALHAGVNPESVVKGLQFAFAKKAVTIDKKILQKLEGEYQSKEGHPPLKITLKGSDLYTNDPSGKELVIKAFSDTHFFLPTTAMELSFGIDDEKREYAELVNHKVPMRFYR